MRWTWLVLAGMILSCASIPEPSQDKRTLVTGQVILKSGVYVSPGVSANVSGVHTMGISMSFTNTDTGETFTFTPFVKDGFFATNQFKPGRYALTQLRFSADDPSGSQWISTYPGENMKFVIRENSINNLGSILWLSDPQKGSFTQFNRDYNRIKEWFYAESPQSKWMSFAWNNVTFSKTLPKPEDTIQSI
jgi:hypothetical protein